MKHLSDMTRRWLAIGASRRGRRCALARAVWKELSMMEDAKLQLALEDIIESASGASRQRHRWRYSQASCLI